VLLANGQQEQAHDVVNEGLKEVANGGQYWMEPELHRIRGCIYESMDPTDKRAEQCYRQALELSQKHGHIMYQLRSVVSLAVILRKQNLSEEAIRIIELAVDITDDGADCKDIQDYNELRREFDL
jgi:hypothetical protein